MQVVVPQTTSTIEPTFTPLRVNRKVLLARNIWRYDLVDPAGGDLAAFTAGSHITVLTPSGVRRSYSLCNDPHERDVYQIAVKRDHAGRGGSISMADDVHEGDLLHAAAPNNHFELATRATRFLFIAGGIGITPILSMMRFLESEGNGQFTLNYLSRDADSTAFLTELSEEFGMRVSVHHNDGDPGHAFDLWPLLEKPSRAHIYCCGPRPLMDAVRDMSGHWAEGSVHFESFGVDSTVRATNVPFRVRLARSGEVLEVPAERTIMETLRTAGFRVPSSCESGVCGACKTRLLEGVADHRDMVLRHDEEDDHLIVCVSRSRGAELVLDL